MKETRLFYCPALPDDIQPPFETTLPDDEAAHVVRVLRLSDGDEILLTNGRGTMARGTICEANKRACNVRIEETWQPKPLWQNNIHLAVAPTKNTDRMEWLVEKATEIGVDRITFLTTTNSERRNLRLDRLQRNAISAMKQSHKARLPLLEGPTPFDSFLDTIADTPFKYIAHCYEEDVAHKPLLLDALTTDGDALVMIGPEGDFSIDEVRAATAKGFQAVSLGESRLRTETAALAAVHMMYLRKRLPQ